MMHGFCSESEVVEAKRVKRYCLCYTFIGIIRKKPFLTNMALISSFKMEKPLVLMLKLNCNKIKQSQTHAKTSEFHLISCFIYSVSTRSFQLNLFLRRFAVAETIGFLIRYVCHVLGCSKKYWLKSNS